MSYQVVSHRYEASRLPNGRVVVNVTVLNEPGREYKLEENTELKSILKLECDGFQFSQVGKKSLNLAIALLTDVYGCKDREDIRRIAMLADPFMREIVARQNDTGFTLTSSEIRNWRDNADLDAEEAAKVIEQVESHTD